MRKARKMVAVMLLMVFGAVSVSFGVDLMGEEENYEKLKAEIEEYGGGEGCKWSEDGKKVISGKLCEFNKVIAFFDEIRAREVTKEQASRWGICFGEKKWKTCDKIDKLKVAINEVKEMPLFKDDSGIRTYRWNNDNWWKYVWQKWETKKGRMEIDGARRGYWKKLAE